MQFETLAAEVLGPDVNIQYCETTLYSACRQAAMQLDS
eukprot:COSAG06_NODE_5238_length_3618_cov_3.369423_2_plen_38_part_00